MVAGFRGAIDDKATTAELEHIATLLPDEWLAPAATGTATSAPTPYGTSSHSAPTPSSSTAPPRRELRPVVDAYRGSPRDNVETTEAIMKVQAAVMRTGNGPFTIEELDLEAPRNDEVLVRMVATGMCHTDLLSRELPPEFFGGSAGVRPRGLGRRRGGRCRRHRPRRGRPRRPVVQPLWCVPGLRHRQAAVLLQSERSTT